MIFLTLQNDFSEREVAAMSDRKSSIDNAHPAGYFRCAAAQFQPRLAGGGTDDFNIAPADAVAPACAEGFHSGLLGGEAGGITLEFILMSLTIFDFRRSEKAFEKGCAVASDGGFDAVDFGDVESQPDDHDSSRLHSADQNYT